MLQAQCLFQGNCVIDTRTRRFCPVCRIQKCFEIGMKADMILGKQTKKNMLHKTSFVLTGVTLIAKCSL